MKITILFFATLRSLTGVKSLEIEMPADSQVSDLKKMISKRYPQVASALVETVLVSINHEFADDEQMIPEGAEVALFPPVSGG
jgi:molybdopterin converting factor subunit 1